MRAVAGLAREIPDPTVNDNYIRNRVIDSLEKNDWCPVGLSVTVRDGVLHLSGVITEERARMASIVASENVAGVERVYDHLCWVDAMSEMYLESPEGARLEKASEPGSRIDAGRASGITYPRISSKRALRLHAR